MKSRHWTSRLLCLALAALTGCGSVRIAGPRGPVWGARHSAEPDSPVFMLGEVRRPGTYAAEPDGDFVELVTRAHGFAETADLDRIEYLRRSGGAWHSYRFGWNRFDQAPVPLAGDVVMVHSTRQSKFERRLQMWAVIASLLASVTALVLAADRR